MSIKSKKGVIFTVLIVFIFTVAVASSFLIIYEQRALGPFTKKIGSNQKAIFSTYGDTDRYLLELDLETRAATYQGLNEFFNKGMIKECGKLNEAPKLIDKSKVCKNFVESNVFTSLKSYVQPSIKNSLIKLNRNTDHTLQDLDQNSIQFFSNQNTKNLQVQLSLTGDLKIISKDPSFTYIYSNPSSYEEIDFTLDNYFKIINHVNTNMADFNNCITTKKTEECYRDIIQNPILSMDEFTMHKTSKPLVQDPKQFGLEVIDNKQKLLVYTNNKYELVNPIYKFGFDFT